MHAPWWGVMQNGVNQPYGNGAPQTPGLPFAPPAPGFGIPGGYQLWLPNITTSAFGAGGLSANLPISTSSGLGLYSAYNKGRVSPGKLPINLDAAVSSVALCGTLAGQLFFGWAGDKFGRKSVYGLTLFVMIFCAAAQSMSFGTNSLAVIGTLCWWRFFLGFGVGGDYPLSATIMSEYSSRLSRGAFVSAVFAMQGIGCVQAAAPARACSAWHVTRRCVTNATHFPPRHRRILTAATVSIIVTASFNSYHPSLPYPADDMAGNPALYYSLIKQSVRRLRRALRLCARFGVHRCCCVFAPRPCADVVLPLLCAACIRHIRSARTSRTSSGASCSASAASPLPARSTCAPRCPRRRATRCTCCATRPRLRATWRT
jgi:hypothetical protein